MRLAFASWRLAPAAFWSMTPREVAAALGRPADAGFDRATLGGLMRRFPDRSPGTAARPHDEPAASAISASARTTA